MTEKKKKKPLYKKLLVSLASLCVLGIVGELGARVVSCLMNGGNPYYLLYGFVSWTNEDGEGHSDKRDGYFKFPPDRHIEFGLPGGGRINNHGFRGADFEAEKSPGTFRVACLGGSSTFGYCDPDDGTYPYLLQQVFEATPSARPVEVLNMGIPHMNTDHIRALFEKEVVDYAPDLITVYSGYNDATYPLAETAFQRTTRWLDEHSAAFAGFRKVLNERAGPVVFGQWSKYPPQIDRERVELQLRLHLEMHEENLRAILELARERGIGVVFVRQVMTAWKIRASRGLTEAPRPPYEEEYARIEAEYLEKGTMADFEVPMYIHFKLMELQRSLAEEYDGSWVDNVDLVDAHPEGLVTYVHLSPEANGRLAERMADTIRGMLTP